MRKEHPLKDFGMGLRAGGFSSPKEIDQFAEEVVANSESAPRSAAWLAQRLKSLTSECRRLHTSGSFADARSMATAECDELAELYDSYVHPSSETKETDGSKLAAMVPRF